MNRQEMVAMDNQAMKGNQDDPDQAWNRTQEHDNQAVKGNQDDQA